MLLSFPNHFLWPFGTKALLSSIMVNRVLTGYFNGHLILFHLSRMVESL